MASAVSGEVQFSTIKTQVFTDNTLSSLPLNDVKSLNPAILRSPINGTALKVFLNGREVGALESVLAAAITCLMDSKMCRVVGSVEFNPALPNCLICIMNLFAMQQNIPIALAIMKLKGIVMNSAIPGNSTLPIDGTPLIKNCEKVGGNESKAQVNTPSLQNGTANSSNEHDNQRVMSQIHTPGNFGTNNLEYAINEVVPALTPPQTNIISVPGKSDNKPQPTKNTTAVLPGQDDVAFPLSKDVPSSPALPTQADPSLGLSKGLPRPLELGTLSTPPVKVFRMVLRNKSTPVSSKSSPNKVQSKATTAPRSHLVKSKPTALPASNMVQSKPTVLPASNMVQSKPTVLPSTRPIATNRADLLLSPKSGFQDVFAVETTRPGSSNLKLDTLHVESITDSIVQKYQDSQGKKTADISSGTQRICDKSIGKGADINDNGTMVTSDVLDAEQISKLKILPGRDEMKTNDSLMEPVTVKPEVKCKDKSLNAKCPSFCSCRVCVFQSVPGPSTAPSVLNQDEGTVSTSASQACNDSPPSAASEDEDMKPFLPPPTQPIGELDKMFESLQEYDKDGIHEPASVILTKMFLHQKQALNWMITRERSTDLAPFWEKTSSRCWYNKGTKLSTDVYPYGIKGGILADDMGLGKTLTVISLIVTNHLDGMPMFAKKESFSKKRDVSHHSNCVDENAGSPSKKTRVESSSDECEVIDLTPAVEEPKLTERHKQLAKRRHQEINNKKKLLSHKALKQPGFSFRQIFLPKCLKRQTKKENKAPKVEKKPVINSLSHTNPTASVHTPVAITQEPRPSQDKNNPRPQIIEKLNVQIPEQPFGPSFNGRVAHNSDMPRLTIKPYKPDAGPSGSARATLIICPLSVLSNWTDQICTHVHPSVRLNVYMYYGGERIKEVKYLKKQDIILTTYPTIGSDFRMNDSPLHKIKWLRIVLDEGHAIRNKNTVWTKAVLKLEAERRWVVTGTPIQNRIGDLWSIVRFLRLDPFSDPTWWKISIANGVTRGNEDAQERLQALIKHISIRRLKDDKMADDKPLVQLPARTVVTQEIELSEEERKIYDTLQHRGRLTIKGYMQRGTVLKNYANCFAILMRLRQLCLHPKLVESALSELERNMGVFAQGDDSDDDDDLDHDMSTERLINQLLQVLSSGVSEECPICLDPLDDPSITRCAHVFCTGCLTDVIENERLAPRCPMCRAPVNQNELVKVPEERLREKETEKEAGEEETAGRKSSAKIDALLKALDTLRGQDPSIKSLVVSQFTSFLDILEYFLERDSIDYLRLDGTMGQEARVKVIDRFRDPDSPKVFLLSLTAGGVGLNLTAATRVFLMDPTWNPATEEQCFDRCHRLGQTEEVIITKYIVNDSVEERMLSLQEEKRELMTAAFGLKARSEEDTRRARVRDIAHLIGIQNIRNYAPRAVPGSTFIRN
ncbi:helicase-like transcription factor isoform X2 [Nematostella vectensis]|uniref:helicase-like transcription factor isoform X2 n=1 Tax=Nematostella vectensis TaxID=45351 RepID=UPI00207757CB|nr:helicase-like transcription factor isoform X2 [Nematostella vectensis]